MEGSRGYLLRDGTCLFLGQVAERGRRARAAVPVDRSPGRVLAQYSSRAWHALVLDCVKERTGVDGVRLSKEDVRTVVVE